MYLTRLSISHLKLLEKLDLAFTNPDGSPRMWTVILGENGTCKSTLLHAIALAATGPEQGIVLAGDMRLSLRDKRFDAPGEVRAHFSPSDRCHGQRTYPGLPAQLHPPTLMSLIDLPASTSVIRGSSAFQDDAGHPLSAGTDPLRDIRAASPPMPHWFCAGYGVARSIVVPQSTTGEARIPVIDRLRSLFHSSHALIGTDFVSRFSDQDPLTFVKRLREVLIDHELLPGIKHIDLRGQNGVSRTELLIEGHRFDQYFRDGSHTRLPAIWLSHGYQSTISWIADLIGQVLLEAKTMDVPLSEMEGIVLVDELDLHLHPRWQRTLITNLKRAFPRVQFVVTTHSPMLLPGVNADEIVVLHHTSSGSVEATQGKLPPANMTGSELYDEFFGVSSAQPREVRDLLDELGLLMFTEPRAEEEERRLQTLKAELRRRGVEIPWEHP